MAERDLQELTDALYANDEAMAYLEGRGLDVSTIVDARLGYEQRGRYRHSITIPYFDGQGRLVTLRWRHLDDSIGRKYSSAGGSGQHLYNVAAVEEPVVYVTEGEFDSLILKQLGYAAVAISGATNFDRAWRWLFRNCDLVYVVMDGDDAGMKARARIRGQIGSVTDAEALHMPAGADITDLYLKDPHTLKELLS